jgi:hypothetical protein
VVEETVNDDEPSIDLNVARVKARWMNGRTLANVIAANAQSVIPAKAPSVIPAKAPSVIPAKAPSVIPAKAGIQF